MKNLDFPVFKTKSDEYKKFDLTDAKSRQDYFEYKAGPEIKKMREYLKKNTFIAYFMGKKSSGKGTYAKMFAEVIDKDRIAHFSIGDMIRSFDEVIQDPARRGEMVKFLEKNYRGRMPLEDIMKSWDNRSTKTLLPTELILALAKREISKLGKKAIFLDGFPRDIDQVSYSLFFRDLIDYRDDPDVFILIDVPTNVIDERVKFRVICPLCQTSRNVKLLATKKVEYDPSAGSGQAKFHLICDNANCPASAKASAGKPGARMTTKEGDEQGIEPIRARLEKDEMLIKEAYNLKGIPKVLLRNSIPSKQTKDFTDDYEITPEYVYEVKDGKVITTERPWEVKDDEGTLSNSLMPPPVVVSLIKQLVKVLGI
ncbi:MAG: nucleoside monophosphate kinase [Candidatus Staskawiczbacteria bacterium]|nr:nucleoside monophosphate kinase [Candidatus Staskawiczbacteria bacterium]